MRRRERVRLILLALPSVSLLVCIPFVVDLTASGAIILGGIVGANVCALAASFHLGRSSAFRDVTELLEDDDDARRIFENAEEIRVERARKAWIRRRRAGGNGSA